MGFSIASKSALVRGALRCIHSSEPALEAGLGEAAHLLRVVDKEEGHVLQKQIRRPCPVIGHDLLARHIEDLDADADGAHPVGAAIGEIGGVAHIDRVLGAGVGKEPVLQVLRDILVEPQLALHHPMGAQEDGPPRRALALRLDAPLGGHGDKHVLQAFDRVVAAAGFGQGLLALFKQAPHRVLPCGCAPRCCQMRTPKASPAHRAPATGECARKSPW
jgi:hypothetical protein